MSQGDVFYSCGACGYRLNLSSSHRTISFFDATYPKLIKKGTISFFFIDETRFKQIDEFKCHPYFQSSDSWGFYQLRTKLLCGRCGTTIGHCHEEELCDRLDTSDTSSDSGTPLQRRYCMKIKALQPLLLEQDRIPSCSKYH
eukprot:c3694_g1_i2 orf=360-785(+)